MGNLHSLYGEPSEYRSPRHWGGSWGRCRHILAVVRCTPVVIASNKKEMRHAIYISHSRLAGIICIGGVGDLEIRRPAACMSQLPPLPAEIRLFGQTWAVVVDPNLTQSLGEYGNAAHFLRRITVAGDTDLSAQWATLLHEVIHAVDHTLVLGLPEETVHRLGAGMWEFVETLFPARTLMGVEGSTVG